MHRGAKDARHGAVHHVESAGSAPPEGRAPRLRCNTSRCALWSHSSFSASERRAMRRRWATAWPAQPGSHTRSSRGSGSTIRALLRFAQRAEALDVLEILRPRRRALHLDQVREPDERALDAVREVKARGSRVRALEVERNLEEEIDLGGPVSGAEHREHRESLVARPLPSIRRVRELRELDGGARATA